jgi:hypothetical protein
VRRYSVPCRSSGSPSPPCCERAQALSRATATLPVIVCQEVEAPKCSLWLLGFVDAQLDKPEQIILQVPKMATQISDSKDPSTFLRWKCPNSTLSRFPVPSLQGQKSLLPGFQASAPAPSCQTPRPGLGYSPGKPQQEKGNLASILIT